MYHLLLPTILFLIFFIADWYNTQKGILPDASNEGNPITKYLHRKAPRWLFHGLHAFYGIAIASLILVGGKLGLWMGYSSIVYNFIGYLSWTKLNRWKQKTNWFGWTPLLLVGSLVIGYLFVSLHEWVWLRQ